TTLTKTGIDGYGVPARNDIFANAMMFRECHCHHDAVRFYRNAVIAVAVIENVVRCVNPRVTLCSTLGCLTLAAPSGACFLVNLRFFRIKSMRLLFQLSSFKKNTLIL
ncbi:MAG: hypothetical protein IKB16_14880, partial [Lentisphaeria bacterium]|nr:hypothetical protein [Lentisphaeria bacterium]